MVQVKTENLDQMRKNFSGVKEKADDFINWSNMQFDERNLDIETEPLLPQKRIRKKKKMPGESSSDEVIEDPLKSFEVNVFNVIVDSAITSLKTRFDFNSNLLYADLANLDPKAFSNIRSEGLHPSAFKELSKRLTPFDERATEENLRTELTHLADTWGTIKNSNLDEYQCSTPAEASDPSISPLIDDENDLDEDVQINLKTCKSCKNCSICCYRLLMRYNLLTGAYSVIGLAFKYMLTLSFTQVACERSFSTLKFIKNRLRSNLGQQKLESFMLMSIEKEVLENLDIDAIIDNVATKSALLKSLLIV